MHIIGIVVLLAMIAGCGDGRPKRVPVSGQVLIDGKPLTLGFIRLTPNDTRPACGEIGPDGRFSLKTFEPGDGAVLGSHKVSIVAIEPLDATRQRWHVPKKYTDPETSGLTTIIDRPTDSLLIEISWDGGKPFVESLQ